MTAPLDVSRGIDMVGFDVVAPASLAALVIGATAGCSAIESALPEFTHAASPATPSAVGALPEYRVGDCFVERVSNAAYLTHVDCAAEHATEVYAIIPIRDDTLPDGPAMKAYKAKCPEAARHFATPEEGLDPTMQTHINYPDQQAWDLGYRQVTCFVSFDTPREGAFGAGRWR